MSDDDVLARFALKRPCHHCPFRTDESAIRFRGRERAEQIEESAYRHGFPCHETAETREDEEGMEGYYLGPDSSFCIGYVIMQINQGTGPWPAIDNDDDLLEQLVEHVGDCIGVPVFETEEDFFLANEKYARQWEGTPDE